MSYPLLDHDSPDALEKEVLEEWKREDLFRKTLAATTVISGFPSIVRSSSALCL